MAKGTETKDSDLDLVMYLNISLVEFLADGEQLRKEISVLVPGLSDHQAEKLARAVCLTLPGGVTCDMCVATNEALSNRNGFIKQLASCTLQEQSRCAPAFAKEQREFIKRMKVTFMPHCKDAIFLAKYWAQKSLSVHGLRSCATEMLVIHACETASKAGPLSLSSILHTFFALLAKLGSKPLFLDLRVFEKTPDSYKKCASS